MEDQSHPLSEYELKRHENIQRNNARLLALGLISTREQEESISSSKKRSISTNKAPSQEPQRKSRRLQGHSASPTSSTGTEKATEQEKENVTTLQQERHQRVEECRLQRQKRALHHAQQTDAQKRAARENPTASYEHALMRIRSMTVKALHSRIKAIERASGKHCVVKMAIFKSCLQDEGLWELAEAASAALERLKALKPAPSQEEADF